MNGSFINGWLIYKWRLCEDLSYFLDGCEPGEPGELLTIDGVSSMWLMEKGDTLLHTALDGEIAELLIGKGLSVNVTNCGKYIPLHTVKSGEAAPISVIN